MHNHQIKNFRSSSNPNISLHPKSKLIETLSDTKRNNTSRTSSISTSKSKKHLFNSSTNFFHNNNSNKSTLKLSPEKILPSLPLLFKKLSYNEIKQKLFNEETKKPLSKHSTEKLLHYNHNNNNPKKLFGKTFYKEKPIHNLRYFNYNENSLSNSCNLNKELLKSFSLLHSNNAKSSDIKRAESFQECKQAKHSNSKTFSIHNSMKHIVKVKNIITNETFKHSSINISTSKRRSYQKHPIKVKEKDIVKVYAYKTQAGTNEEKCPKINQDTCFIKYKINGIKNFNMFGILDGHGCNGHHVSKCVSDFISANISEHSDIKSLTSTYEIYLKLKEDNYKIIKDIYYKAEEHLRSCDFDCNFSGSTCNIIFQLGYNIICSNVGDSRAILVYKHTEMNAKYEYMHLSIDHKPTLQNEKKRIIKNGGRVEQYVEYGVKSGPFRVWLKDESYPGLAVSRSIGDLVASNIGVIPEPEISEHIVIGSSKYLIIASDGVWEFLDSESVMQMTVPYYENVDAEGMCKCVIENATKYWIKEDIVMDDISIVAILF